MRRLLLSRAAVAFTPSIRRTATTSQPEQAEVGASRSYHTPPERFSRRNTSSQNGSNKAERVRGENTQQQQQANRGEVGCESASVGVRNGVVQGPVSLQVLLVKGMTMRTTCRDILKSASDVVSKNISEASLKSAEAVVKGFARLCHTFVEESKLAEALTIVSAGEGGSSGNEVKVLLGNLVLPSWQSFTVADSATPTRPSEHDPQPQQQSSADENRSSVDAQFDSWVKQKCSGIHVSDLCQLVAVISLFIKQCYLMQNNITVEIRALDWGTHLINAESLPVRSPMGCMWLLRSALLRVIVSRLDPSSAPLMAVQLIPGALVYGPRPKGTPPRCGTGEVDRVLKCILELFVAQSTATEHTVRLFFSVAVAARRFSISKFHDLSTLVISRGLEHLRVVEFSSNRRDVLELLQTFRTLFSAGPIEGKQKASSSLRVTYAEACIILLSRSSAALLSSFSSMSKVQQQNRVDSRRLNKLVLHALASSVTTGEWVFLELPNAIRTLIVQFAVTELRNARNTEDLVEAAVAIPLCGVPSDNSRCAAIASELPSLIDNVTGFEPLSSSASGVTAKGELQQGKTRRLTQVSSQFLLLCRSNVLTPADAGSLCKQTLQKKNDLSETVQRNYCTIFSPALEQHLQMTLDVDLPRFLSNASLQYVQYLAAVKSSTTPQLPGDIHEFLLECLALALKRKVLLSTESTERKSSAVEEGNSAASSSRDSGEQAASTKGVALVWSLREAEIIIRTMYLHWYNNTADSTTSFDSYIQLVVTSASKRKTSDDESSGSHGVVEKSTDASSLRGAFDVLRMQLRSLLVSALSSIRICPEQLSLISSSPDEGQGTGNDTVASTQPMVTIALCAAAIGICTVEDLATSFGPFAALGDISVHQVMFNKLAFTTPVRKNYVLDANATDAEKAVASAPEILLYSRLRMEGRDQSASLSHQKLCSRVLAADKAISVTSEQVTHQLERDDLSPGSKATSAKFKLLVWLSRMVASAKSLLMLVEVKSLEVALMAECIAFYIRCACALYSPRSQWAVADSSSLSCLDMQNQSLHNSLERLVRLGESAVAGGHSRALPTLLVVLAHSAMTVSLTATATTAPDGGKVISTSSSCDEGVTIRVLPGGSVRADITPPELTSDSRLSTSDVQKGQIASDVAAISVLPGMLRDLLIESLMGLLYAVYLQVRASVSVLLAALNFQAAVIFLRRIGVFVLVDGVHAVTELLHRLNQDRRSRLNHRVEILKLATLSLDSGVLNVSHFAAGIASFVAERLSSYAPSELKVILICFELVAIESDKLGQIAVNHNCRSTVHTLLETLVRRFVQKTLVDGRSATALATNEEVVGDEDDVALSLLCRGVLVGCYSGLADEMVMLKLLSLISSRQRQLRASHLLLLTRAAEQMLPGLRNIVAFLALKELVLACVLATNGCVSPMKGDDEFVVTASTGIAGLCIGDRANWNKVLNVAESAEGRRALDNAGRIYGY